MRMSHSAMPQLAVVTNYKNAQFRDEFLIPIYDFQIPLTNNREASKFVDLDYG